MNMNKYTIYNVYLLKRTNPRTQWISPFDIAFRNVYSLKV